MHQHAQPYLLTATLALALTANSSYAISDFSGRLGLGSRTFYEIEENQSSLYLEPELYIANQDESNSLFIKVFAREDSLDKERSHVDIRELFWLHVGSNWEFRAGINKIYWGVTESNHLVDIINQTDFVESADGEQKLGQPMLHYTQISDWGVVDAFILAGFRERTFPGKSGRLNGPLTINTDTTQYESEREDHHTDFALRYSQSIDVFDIGLSWFNGTNRDPILTPNVAENQAPTLTVYYDQMQQFGLDLQTTLGDWLWKLETIDRKDSIDHYQAITAGFEYTFMGIAGSSIDMGLLNEYSYDSRGETAPTVAESDVFIGSRFTFNDVQSTDLLIGLSRGINDPSSQLIFIEGSRRIGNNFKATIDARFFNGKKPNDLLTQLKDDDYLSFSIDYFY